MIKNINKFYKSKANIIALLIILIFSSIPWIDFVLVNIKEKEFILNYNYFLFFIINFVFLIFIFFILKKTTTIKEIYLSNIICFSYWSIFQHETIKYFLEINLDNFFKALASEIALVLIITLISFSVFLSKKKLFNHFIIYFLSFNFIYLAFNFSNTFEFTKVINNQVITKKNSSKQNNRNNIYFVVVDGMMPIDDFEQFFKDKKDSLEDFKNEFRKYNYTYYTNTYNKYSRTNESLAAFFNLKNEIKKDLDRDRKILFPEILKPNFNPNLIRELKKSNYEFKWIGNSWADCIKFNLNYCLQNSRKFYFDNYLISAFLSKTPLKQIFASLLEINFFKQNFNVFKKNNALKNFTEFSQTAGFNKSTFYFIHHFHPHWPYVLDRNCNIKTPRDKSDINEYKENFLCVTNQIVDFIKYLEKNDKNAIVVFQSDHNWYLAREYNKYGQGNKLFSLIKNNIMCNSTIPKNFNNVNTINYILKCIKSG